MKILLQNVLGCTKEKHSLFLFLSLILDIRCFLRPIKSTSDKVDLVGVSRASRGYHFHLRQNNMNIIAGTTIYTKGVDFCLTKGVTRKVEIMLFMRSPSTLTLTFDIWMSVYV